MVARISTSMSTARSTSISCRWCSNRPAATSSGRLSSSGLLAGPSASSSASWASRSRRPSRRSRTTTTESPSAHMFLSCTMDGGPCMAPPIAWSGVDQAGPGAPLGSRRAAVRGPLRRVMPPAISRPLLPNYHFGHHSLGRSFSSRFPPESGPVKKLKASDLGVAPSGIRRIERKSCAASRRLARRMQSAPVASIHREARRDESPPRGRAS